MASAPSGSFFAKRLHSLTGVVPIGYYLIQHLALNFSSQIDQGNLFNRVVGGFASLPRAVLLPIEIFVLALPIGYHSAYGIYMTFRGRPRPLQYGFVRNWMYFWMRISGILILAFMIVHVWQMTIHPRMTAQELNLLFVHRVVSEPVWLAAYIVGVLAAVSHLANGLWSFCITWGITAGERSQRVSAWVFGVAGLVLFAVGMGALQGFFVNAPHQSAVADPFSGLPQ